MSSSPFHILPVLYADAPYAPHAEKLELFGQFVGVWDMEIKFFDEGGNIVYYEPGEWSFSWVLDGRVIQDVLTYADPKSMSLPGGRRIGTTLRHYEPKQDTWRIVWLGAVSGILIVLNAKTVGSEIWIEGTEDDGTLNQWKFSDLRENNFTWTGQISTDGGASWRLEQEMLARRRDTL